MSQKVMIELKNVSKAFVYVKDRPQSIKSLLVQISNGSYFRLKKERKVVLENVSFQITTGEIVGLMGRNGTGKSTLLRILSGIYKADSGRMQVNGTIAPLVALGAGFHNDLSGYENIFLNGAILGIERKELIRLAPSIIEFAELADQIHLPIKNYSSGMILRLGFSVAVHVEAPILLLDEVIGVGDAGFQAKCLAKIQELFNQGRTVVIVTHDPETVRRFCTRCIVMESGKVIFDGKASEGADVYSRLFQ